MDFMLFKKIVDDLFQHHKTERIDLHILGEALLHPQVFDMIAYIDSQKKYPVQIELATNGLLLTNTSIQEKLLSTKLNLIGISVRATNEEEYKLKLAQNQPSMSYRDYLDSLTAFIHRVHRKRSRLLISLGYFHTVFSSFPLVFPYSFINKTSQVESLIRSWHKTIEGYPQTIPLKKIEGFKYPEIYSLGNRTFRLSENLELRIERIMLWQNQLLSDAYFIKESATGDCSLAQSLNIAVNGNAIKCCLDYNSDMKFGNLNESSIDEISKNESYRKFRSSMDEGKLISPICRKCLGTLYRKDTGKAVRLNLSKPLLFFLLLKENPGLLLKRMKERLEQLRKNLNKE